MPGLSRFAFARSLWPQPGGGARSQMATLGPQLFGRPATADAPVSSFARLRAGGMAGGMAPVAPMKKKLPFSGMNPLAAMQPGMKPVAPMQPGMNPQMGQAPGLTMLQRIKPKMVGPSTTLMRPDIGAGPAEY